MLVLIDLQNDNIQGQHSEVKVTSLRLGSSMFKDDIAQSYVAMSWCIIFQKTGIKTRLELTWAIVSIIKVKSLKSLRMLKDTMLLKLIW